MPFPSLRFVIPSEFRALDRRIWVLAGLRCINTAAFSVVMPYLALYLNTRLGTSLGQVGAIYGVSSVVAALATFAGGELSDRVGRRKLMATALSLRALGLVGLGLAIHSNAGLLAIASMVVWNGLLRGLFEPAAQSQVALLVDAQAPPGENAATLLHRRTAAFGLQRVGINLGWALGPAAGGFLAAHSYPTMFFCSAPITLVAAALVLAVPEPARCRAPSTRLRVSDLWAVPHPVPWLVFLAVVLLMSVMTTQVHSTMSVFAMAQLHVAVSDFGLLYSINGLMVVLLQSFAVRFIRQVGLSRALVIGPLVYGAGYFLFAFARGFPSLALGVIVVTLGELVTEPAEMTAATELGDRDRPGRVMGVFGLVNTLGNSAGPLVGGHIYDRTLGQPFRLWGSIAALGVVGAMGYGFVEALASSARRVGIRSSASGGDGGRRLG